MNNKIKKALHNSFLGLEWNLKDRLNCVLYFNFSSFMIKHITCKSDVIELKTENEGIKS